MPMVSQLKLTSIVLMAAMELVPISLYLPAARHYSSRALGTVISRRDLISLISLTGKWPGAVQWVKRMRAWDTKQIVRMSIDS